MSNVAPTEVTLAVDAAQAAAVDGGLKGGQLVYGRVLSHGDGRALLTVLGQRVHVVMTEPVRIGQMIPLRVTDIQQPSAPSDARPVAAVSESVAADASAAAAPVLSDVSGMVKSVRRLVDAAALRLFGEAPARINSPRIMDVDPEAILRIAVRGERPQRPLLNFEPETLRASPALAGASAEELLAAQAALERLNVPATPLTIAAALPDANDPARLVDALRRMNAMLEELGPEGRIATLRTLAEFLSRIEPQKFPLDAQISSFVDQIATGGERKLMELLSVLALRTRSTAAERLILTSKATERATSLTHDLKTQLLAFANGPDGQGDLLEVLTRALEAVTAAQLTSLHAARKLPGAIAFVLPIVGDKMTHAAQITVQRDSPEGRNRPLDAQNFRIGFALETRRLGLVRVDIECVRRAVRVTVDAQTTSAADEIRTHLDRLRELLEARGFRSVAMTAQCVRRAPYKEEASAEDAHTYVPQYRGVGGDPTASVHLDTKA